MFDFLLSAARVYNLDITALTVERNITVADIQAGDGIELLAEPDETVAGSERGADGGRDDAATDADAASQE